jgi:hypothetical protein
VRPASDPQLTAFPFDSPDTLVLHYARLLSRVTKLAALLTPDECLRLLGDVSLGERLLDQIELVAKARVERAARSVGLIA